MIQKIPVDDALLEEACLLGEHSTREAAVDAALREYISRHRRMKIVDLFGTIDFDPAYDYKTERHGRTT